MYVCSYVCKRVGAEMSASVEDFVGERILKNVMIRGQDGIMRERLLHTYIHTYIHIYKEYSIVLFYECM